MRKLKSIVLHMGSDKTGSTDIQSVLSSNEKCFEKLGVIYSAGLNHKVTRNDRLLSIAFCESKDRAGQLFYASKNVWAIDSKKYISILKKNIGESEANVLVLSHEGMMHLNELELTRMSQFLFEIAESVSVVLYAREPASYAISAMTQRVKTGRRAWSMKQPPVIQFRDSLQRIISVFGRENVNVRLFDSNVFPSGDVVLDFLSIPPLKALHVLDKKALVREFKGNPGFSDTGLRVGDRIVEILGDQAPVGKRFRRIFSDDLYRLKGQKVTLSKQQSWWIQKISASEIEFLNHEFGVVFSNSTNIFCENLIQKKSSQEVETMARDLIALRLPAQQLSWLRGVWRRILCLNFSFLKK